MTRESILGEVRTVIGELTDRAPEGVNAGARFSELGVDSVAAVELLARLEELYDLYVPPEDAVHLVTVDDVVRYVARHAS